MSPREPQTQHMASTLDKHFHNLDPKKPTWGLEVYRCTDCRYFREPDPVPLREILERAEDSDTSHREDNYYCYKDIRIQSLSSALLDKMCYYYHGLTSEQSRILLRNSEVGTYLIRDSSDPKYLYSLSVKTERGPTSVRITYFKGKFQFDCERRLKNDLPKFDCIIKLVDYYTRQSKQMKNTYRWLENSGKKDLKMFLVKPRLNQVPSLKHLSRLSINRSFPLCTDARQTMVNIQCLPLPELLKVYLNDYPYLN